MQSFLQMFSKYYSIRIPKFVFQSFCLLFYAVFLTNHIHKPVSKKTIVEKTHFSQNQWFSTFCELASLRSAPGLRPVICLAVFSANPCIKKTHTTYKKHFLFWLTHPIKTVSKNTIVEKETFSLQKHDFERFLIIQPPCGRLHGPCGAGPGLRPVLCLAVFLQPPSINKHIQLSKNIFHFGSHIQLKQFQKTKMQRKKHFSLQKHDFESLLIIQPPSGRLHGPCRGRSGGFAPVICLAVFSTNPFYKQNTYYLLKTFFILVSLTQ